MIKKLIITEILILVLKIGLCQDFDSRLFIHDMSLFNPAYIGVQDQLCLTFHTLQENNNSYNYNNSTGRFLINTPIKKVHPTNA